MKRITLSLTYETVEMIDSVSQALSVSRSALINQLLSTSLPPMVDLFSELSAASADNPHGDIPAETLRRLRGKSADVVKAAVADAQDALTDLEALPHDRKV